MNSTRRWPLFLIAAPAAVAVWSGWVGLGGMCGFGVIHPLPGIWDAAKLNTAITLPIGVESYGTYALGAWLTPGTSDAARKFARGSAIGALALGMLGQIAYHLLSAAHTTRAPWPVVALVACLPVVTLGFGAALTHLLGGQDAATAMAALADTTATEADSVTGEAVMAAPEPPRPSALTVPPCRTATANQPDRAASRPGHARTAGVTGHRDRAAEILARRPDITGAELGSELGVSERTGRRILAAMATD